MSRALAILTAAGSGTRLGADVPKALVELDGKPLVIHAALGMARGGVAAIVVTAPPEKVCDFQAVFPDGVIRVDAGSSSHPDVPVDVVAGSPASRQASVALGLVALPALAQRAGTPLSDDTCILVHDAARCLTPPAMIARVVDAVEAGNAAVIPALPVSDTLKELGDPTEPGVRPVVSTPERSRLGAVQTPQGFTWKTLRQAHDNAAARADSELTAATDDAGLVEAAGGTVVAVEGDPDAVKVTTAVDLALAELLLRTKKA